MTAKVLSPPVPSPSTRPPSPVRKPVPPPKSSPVKSSPRKPSPEKLEVARPPLEIAGDEPIGSNVAAEVEPDEARSPSDNSSPIRPVVRKSSMNFASLPAREPLTSKKSVGAGMSRLSNLDQSRTSYYNRNTGGKSLGGAQHESEDEDQDDMDIDDDITVQNTIDVAEATAAHNKTYTQRLQDRISLLGAKAPATASQPSRSQATSSSQNAFTPYSQPQQPAQPPRQAQEAMQPASPRKQEPIVAPGAFPTDDEDDWIALPATAAKEPSIFSPRPVMAKSYSADVMEGVVGKATVGESEFAPPKQRQQVTASGSPKREPAIPERSTSIRTHNKSASVPHLPSTAADLDSPRKAISVSNPALATVPESGRPSATPSKSPSRNFRDSPLKQVKNKLSSILKSSKGLLASSAAISAEGKSSLLSPSTTRLGIFAGPSTESLVPGFGRADTLYPDLTQYAAVTEPQSPSRPESPARSTATRRTRASAEREKREQKQKEKEMKDAQRLADQMGKLEKAREKEREKARVFSEEQEKVVLEKQLMAQKERQRAEQPAPSSPTREAAKPTRTSPRKAKAQADAEGRSMAVTPGPAASDMDVDMVDAPGSMAPPTAPRSAVPSQANRGVKRPIKPTKEATSKTKQAPTVIRVNTTSAQHSQYHPSNSVLAATLQDTLGPQQHQLKSKASSASLQTKPSLQSLKSSVSSSGRPKALELAAKRKEQEEREAQRKREAKAEMERKRAALQEEERRQDEQRRLEAQRQKEREREQVAAQAEAKKSAQRQAALEKAKQTRAPPPPQRAQPNGPPDYSMSRAEPSSARPPSRLNSTLQRPQDEPNRLVNAVLSNTAKAPPKRPLQAEGNEESARPGIARNGPSYQHQEAKRMRMSEEFDEDELEMGGQPSQSKIKGPPVRPSGGFKKVCGSASVHVAATNVSFRNCHRNPSSPTATRRRRETCSSRRSRRNITARPRPPTLWTWRRSPNRPFPSHQIPTLPGPRRTRLPPGRRACSCPANRQPSRRPGHHLASRTATPSNCPRSRRTTRTARTTATSGWRRGRTRRTCARHSRAKRPSTPCRSSGRPARLTWRRSSARAKTGSTSSGRARAAPTGAVRTA